MKIHFRFIPILLLGGGLLLTGCEENDGLPPPPGSAEDNTRYDAPKVVQSTEIVTFYCKFSMIDMVLPEGDSELADNVYTLTAEWKDGVVTGRYSFYAGSDYRGSDQSFQAERAFLDELQELVAKHDLPRYNGISCHVYGLPEDYGASLSITYASGESVYADDNQNCFLTTAAMKDLMRLFRQQAEREATRTDTI